MNVQQLILCLEKIEDKTMEVCYPDVRGAEDGGTITVVEITNYKNDWMKDVVRLSWDHRLE